MSAKSRAKPKPQPKHPEKLRQALAEKERRRLQKERLYSTSFPEQRAICDSPAKRKSGLCTRRAGKTNAFANKCVEFSIDFPKRNFLFVGLTAQTAWDTLVKDALIPALERANVRYTANEQKKTVRFNRCVLYFLGIDANKKQREKALGKKYKLVAVDECASITIDLKEFVEKHIGPALIDENGECWLIGTPNSNVHTFFYKVTSGEVPGWTRFEWSAADNPHIRKNWLAEIKQLIAETPGIEETPWFIQNMLGKWAVDESAQVYKFLRSRNGTGSKPAGNWAHVLGIDLGHSPDPTAFVVIGYRDYDPSAYVLHAYKRTAMNLDDINVKIRQLERQFGTFQTMVIDGANKQFVKELQNRFGLPLINAEKAGKAEFISLLNTDLQVGRLLFLLDECKPLTEELSTHIWREEECRKGNWVESDATPNDCCDAMLYAWRWCYNWAADRSSPVRALSDEEQVEQYWKEQDEQKDQSIEQAAWETNTLW